MDTYRILDKEYQITGYTPLAAGVPIVPVVDIPEMSTYKWQKMCMEDRKKHPEVYAADGENVPAKIKRLEQWLADYETAGGEV